MFLGLIVFLILAVVGSALITRAARAALRSITGRGKGKEHSDGQKSRLKEKPKGPKPDPEEEHSPEINQPVIEEQTRSRYASALRSGISESFWTDESSFSIDSKLIADACTSDGSLSYLEYNNRQLAGKEFHGFNLLVEEDSRMVLTYGGGAVASLTLTEKGCPALINGQSVMGTVPAWRVNTFPPELKPGMVTTDLEKVIDAGKAIRECGGDPEKVSRTMVDLFKSPDNVSLLKTAIDRKIQAKESLRKGPRSQKPQRSPVRL